MKYFTLTQAELFNAWISQVLSAFHFNKPCSLGHVSCFPVIRGQTDKTEPSLSICSGGSEVITQFGLGGSLG